MTKPLWIIACVVCFILGVASVYLYSSFAGRDIDEPHQAIEQQNTVVYEGWINLSKPSNSEKGLISYSSDALFKSIVTLPEISSIAGKAKFVKTPGNHQPDTKLGYVIDIALAPADESAKQEKPAPNQNTETKKSSSEAIYYDAIFYFILKDKDGFPLMKTASNKETIHTGDNRFQLYANNAIPAAIAANTKAIDMRIEIVKCLTCKIDQPEHPPRRHSFF